jgi:glycosyltransferase involved in cell wall biosynthesis
MFGVVLAVLSVFGILGMTVLFPLLAALIGCGPQRSGRSNSRAIRISIIIPARNEEQLLPVTLQSISRAIEATSRSLPQCSFRVVVGADGCTDNTEKAARDLGAEVLYTPEPQGKWRTILALVEHCAESEWIVLADCGVTWPETFLTQITPLLRREEIIAVAPSYRNDSGGIMERIVWGIERALKRIESWSGGPVSVHGATVCYRTKELRSALKLLSHQLWLNDDVVIPLCLRALHPTKAIHYISDLAVQEAATSAEAPQAQFRRRRRIAHGNIQWITQMWQPVWNLSSLAGLLAMRRVFRVLWAYWVCSSTGALALHLGLFYAPTTPLLVFGALVITALFVVPQLRSLTGSGLASILAPYYLVAAVGQGPNIFEGTEWK